MSDLDNDRMAALEARIERLERALEDRGPSAAAGSPAPPARPVRSQVFPSRPAANEPGERAAPRNLAPQILGISGVGALVLAASYLIRLALDSGWLTPARQLAIAGVAAVGCIAGGLWLKSSGKRHASLLSAAGVAIGFLTVYGAHLLHGFIDSGLATGLVAALCLVALWLGRAFGTEAYALLAVVGAYSTPFLVRAEEPDVVRLVLYYSAWSALFCSYSLWVGGRHAYLVASLLAVAGFDLIWRLSGSAAWETAVVYQALQFLLFTATTALYSVKHRSPLTPAVARAHAPSLFFFYAIEYAMLDAHLPRWAPWIAFASVLVVLAAYLAARPRLAQSAAGARLVSWYTALVLFQAGYLELVPGRAKPWVALALFVGLGALARRRDLSTPVLRPLLLAAALVCLLNYLRVLADVRMDEVPLAAVLYVSYAAVLYAAYALTRARSPLRVRAALLYAAQIAAMVAVYRLVDRSVVVSVLWGAIAIASLAVALRRRDRILAQSSFLVFAASGLKVMNYDLEGSSPLVRIGSLAVLGASLYAGGWLYQRLEDVETGSPES